DRCGHSAARPRSLQWPGLHPELPSFPTRRSSDLLITLKSELAGRMLPAHPDLAARQIADIEQVSRQAMTDVREAVTGYRRPRLGSELARSEEHTSELQSRENLVCRLLLEKKKQITCHL